MNRTPRHFKAILFSRAASAAGFQLRCHFCPMMLDYATATVDHEPPIFEGGTARCAVLSCNECNQRRGRETNAKAQAKRQKKGGQRHKRKRKR